MTALSSDHRGYRAIFLGNNMGKELLRASALAIGLSGLLASVGVQAANRIATPDASSRMNASTMRADGSYDRFIVTYRKGTPQATNHAAVVQDVSAAIGRAGLASPATAGSATAGVVYLRKLAIGADLVRTSRKLDRDEATDLMRQIASDPAVLHVEPDVVMHAIGDYTSPATIAASDFTPDDPDYQSYQWHLRAGNGAAETIGGDTTSYANKGGSDIARAWELADGNGVTVAVLDTGITHHPDIDTSLGDEGYDFVSSALYSGRPGDGRVPGGWDTGDWTNEEPWLSACTDAFNPPAASSWHGTHVSGTIAELTDNNEGMAGSAYNAKVLPVRVLGHCGGLTSDIADAIVWASGGHVDGVPDNTHPAQVISMSLGGTGICTASDATGSAIADAISRGTTVVVATGNSNDDAAYYSPASCPGVISVSSVGITGKRAFYSNYGDSVTIAAPGGGIFANDASAGTQVYAGFVWSAGNGGLGAPEEDNYVYMGMAGTSQATPHVSGTVAMIIGALADAGLPALSPGDIKSLLVSTARPFPTAPDRSIGAGIVDAYAAVNQAIGGDDDGGGDEDGDDATELANGATLTGLSGSAGDTRLYKLEIPAGARALVLRTFGGSGNVSLYVSRDAVPNDSDYDHAAVHAGNNESVVVARPAAGTYYLQIVGVTAFSNVTLQGTFVAPTP